MVPKEILTKIKINNAKILNIQNIVIINDYLQFVNNDPQIVIKFKQKQKNVNIKIKLKKPMQKPTNIVVYYSTNKKNFDASKSIVFNAQIIDEFERNIIFDDNIKYLRLDLSDENINFYLDTLEININRADKYQTISQNLHLNHKMNVLTYMENNKFDWVIKNTKQLDINLIDLKKNDMLDYYDLNNHDNNKYDFVEIKKDNKLEDIICFFRYTGIENIIIFGIADEKLVADFKDYGFNIILVIDSIDKCTNSLINKIDWILIFDDCSLISKKIIKIKDENTICNKIIDCISQGKNVNPALDLYLWGSWNKQHFLQRQGNKKSILKKYVNLYCAILNGFLHKQKIINDSVVLLDTYIGSDNEGDNIIMDYCTKIMNEIDPNPKYQHVSTHVYDIEVENMKNKRKILCGTNIIYKNMEKNQLWSMPNDYTNLKDIILLGVGLQGQDINKKMSIYSKIFFKYVLSHKGFHAVRDEHTKQALERIGITNVLNTACPTMWGLNKEFCKLIPKLKSEDVITTITDYEKDAMNDTLMLTILKNNYRHVYIWIQGQYDYEYLSSIIDINDFILIPPKLSLLDQCLKNNNVDYIGTRLHAGIRSLNNKKRSLIIAIDNRARDIGADTGLPVLERNEISVKLETWINSEYITQIELPEKNIQIWKNQFRK